MFQKISSGFPVRRASGAALLGVMMVFAGGAKANSAPPVFAMGYDQDGELGDGGGANRPTPQTIAGIPTAVVSLAAGSLHSLALTSGGSVYAWGLNSSGQLGDGTTTTRKTPIQVKLEDGTPLSHVVAISGGDSFSLALTSDGNVYAWGLNSSGQLGDGTTTNRTTPTFIAFFPSVSISGVVGIAAGANHSLALGGNGKVYAWGYNVNGQLGDGTTTQRVIPTLVPGLSKITAITSGGYHSLALDSSGAVFAWGSNKYGQLSVGTADNKAHSVPTAVLTAGGAALGGVSALAAGQFHTVFLAGGLVSGVGFNGDGELGDGTKISRAFPVPTTLTNVKTIAAGGSHTLAISGGSLYAWGQDLKGQIGDGTTAISRPSPTLVSVNGPVGAIAGGGSHTLFIQAAYASVSGVLTFEGIDLLNAGNQGVVFQFAPGGGSPALVRLASVSADGAFTVAGVPQGQYSVLIKGTKYLAKLTSADASTGDVSGLTAFQGAADSNNDNSVDSTDFTVLIGSFNSDRNISGSGYDPSADFNDDGFVDSSDFTLLIGQFNNVGDSLP